LGICLDYEEGEIFITDHCGSMGRIKNWGAGRVRRKRRSLRSAALVVRPRGKPFIIEVEELFKKNGRNLTHATHLPWGREEGAKNNGTDLV